MALAEEHATSIAKGAKPLSTEDAEGLLQEVPGWTIEARTLNRWFKFDDFRQAMAFVNGAAGIADEEDHHPDIFISYNKVKISLSTHKVGGLTRNDFILAARIGETPEARSGKG